MLSEQLQVHIRFKSRVQSDYFMIISEHTFTFISSLGKKVQWCPYNL